jgi:hypothetical protein
MRRPCLAVVAKKEMLCQALRAANGRRPKYEKAIVPKRPSVGIHVLTAKDKVGGALESWTPEHQELCQRVLRAFPQLQYVAYSFVVPEETDKFTKVQVDHLVTSPVSPTPI